jgi:hypothetical protein
VARLTTDQVKQGLLHPDPEARSAALHYFADDPRPDPTVMPVVIQALDRFGRAGAFRFTHAFERLPQTAATVRWAIGELNAQPGRAEGERTYLWSVSRLLARADPYLVAPHAAEILAAPGFDPDCRDRLTRRVGHLAWDGDALWAELERLCRDNADAEYGSDFPWEEAEDVVEALGRQGDRHADRMMAILDQEVTEFENNPAVWLEMLTARLAGELRYEPAVPLLVRKLHIDAELLDEEAAAALSRIGTDGVIEAIRAAYPPAEWFVRLYAGGVLGRVHSDAALRAGMELCESEPDPELQTHLAVSVVGQLSTEGNEFARRRLLDDPDDYELLAALVPACTLTGQEFPELGRWREELVGRRSRFRRVSDEPSDEPPAYRGPAPFIRDEIRVGRNDLCPCGSGKKFKKCCLNKREPF